MQVLQTNIEWAKQEKRIFLKQSLETRLVGLCVVCCTSFVEGLSEYMAGSWKLSSISPL